MQELAVVTLTNGLRSEWLEGCVDSVRRALPPGAVHHILKCPSIADFAQTKKASLSLAKYVVYVDDDDLVINDSIRRCLEAVKEEKVAVAFTDEVLIDELGHVLESLPLRQNLCYQDIAMAVRTVHHTALFETAQVHRQFAELISNTHLCSGVDWLIVATAALQSGAVHIPIRGYQWRLHPDNQHKAVAHEHANTYHILRAFFSTMVGQKTLIKRLPEDTL